VIANALIVIEIRN